MRRPPNSRHREHTARHPRHKGKAAAAPEPERRTVHHRLYGDIPLIPRPWTDAQGRERQGFEYDLDYQPVLPEGAIRGDVRKQEFCSICHYPRYFYVDVPRTCVQCQRPFVFRAAEQKLWYETLKFHFDAVPTRCLSCRRKRRSERAVHQQLVAAKAQARAQPDDPAGQLALAEAIVRYAQRTGRGPIAEAIAASRKARRLVRGHPAREACETYFWEGMSQALAGRADHARELLGEFLRSALRGRRQAALAKEARALLG